MSSIDDILATIPMNSLASQLGVDPATAESAVREALPALVGGMQANAADPRGAASLAGALDNHSPQLVDGGVNLDEVDTADGEKIVSHVFGENSGAGAQTLGGNLGGKFCYFKGFDGFHLELLQPPPHRIAAFKAAGEGHPTSIILVAALALLLLALIVVGGGILAGWIR